MKKTQQKDAVYDTVMEVLRENGVTFVPNEDILSEVMDKDLRTAVITKLFVRFKTGEIILSKDFNDKDLKVYIGGLVSNWTKKDFRLNGNIPHEIRSPGSRIGQSDPMVRELRKMLKSVKGTKHEIPVKVELRKRQDSLRKQQATMIVINKEHIPESLHHLLN